MSTSVVGASLGSGVPLAKDFTAQFVAFKKAAGLNDFASLKKQIQDDSFLQHLADDEMKELMRVLEMAIRKPYHLDFVQTVCEKCPFQLETAFQEQFKGSNLSQIYHHFHNFQDYDDCSSEDLNAMAICMAQGHHWPVVDILFNEKFDELTPRCLGAIVEELPTNHPEWEKRMEKIISKIAADKSHQTSICLIRIALKADQSGHESIARSILKNWEHLSPFPLRLDNMDMILKFCPKRTAECILSFVQTGRFINLTDFMTKNVISDIAVEDLGIILMASAAYGSTTKSDNLAWHEYQQEFIGHILQSKEAKNIPQFCLRQALLSLSFWLDANQLKEEPSQMRKLDAHRKSTLAACETLKKLIV